MKKTITVWVDPPHKKKKKRECVFLLASLSKHTHTHTTHPVRPFLARSRARLGRHLVIEAPSWAVGAVHVPDVHGEDNPHLAELLWTRFGGLGVWGGVACKGNQRGTEKPY